MPKLRCSGVALAGGHSSRMGKNKARLVTPEGETLLDRTWRILSEVANRGCWISGAAQYCAYPIISDSRPGGGPVFGISASLEALRARTDVVIFVPIDMPSLEGDFLQLLVEACSIDGVEAAYFRDHPLPLVIRTHSRCVEAAHQTIESEQPSIKSLLSRLRVSELDSTGNHRFLINVNTPDEWEVFMSGVEL